MAVAMDRVEAVREAAREITKRYDRAYWRECVREGRFPSEMWKALAEAGLLGISVPEEYGGSGGGALELVAMVEVLAEAGVVPLGLALSAFARMPILKHGTPEQIERFVKPTVTGETIMCFGITEPNAGTNTFKMQTLAQPTDDGWIVNGQKVFISGADQADYMLLLARTKPFTAVEDRRQGLSVFVVDTKAPGIEMHPLNIQATAPEKQFQIFFNNVHVPADRIVGQEDMGTKYIFDGMNTERLVLAAMCIGTGNLALQRAVDYAKQRAPFGQPIGSYQGLQHPMAHAKAQLEAARLMMYDAARRFDAGENAGPGANMAKLLASEAAGAAVDVALQAHGGNGFDADYDIITFATPIRLMRVAPINNEMILNYIGEHVLGLPKSY